MRSAQEAFVNAKNLAIDNLRSEKQKTAELIRQTAIKAAEAQKIFDPTLSIDVEQLTAELRHAFSVGAESATALDDVADHEPWLASKRGAIQWRFWNRYMTYLERDFGMPPAIV